MHANRAPLEAESSRHRVLPRGRVKDTRSALIEQVRETRLVLPAARFALTEQESADFARKASRHTYGDDIGEDAAAEIEAGGDGVGTADPSITPEDADLDRDEADETADLSASPQDADLDHENGDGDLDGDARPQIEAADRADAPHEARI